MTTSKIQMDQIRSTSATDTGENIRAGSQKKSSLSPAEGLQGASPDATCTCPSGDGSLVHPCPAHPAPVEQAGGDERAAFRPAQVISYRPGVGEVTIYVAGRVPGYMNIGDTVYVSDRAPVEQPIAALAQPSPVSEPLIYACKSLAQITSSDGSGHADIAMAVLRMAGVGDDERERLVNEWKAARAWKPSPGQAEKAEAERPEVVGVRYEDGTILSAEDCGTALEVCAKVQTPLMTVAQHERIAASRWERAMDLMGDHVARISDKLTAERDAALAEVERLRQFERICEGLPQDAIDGCWTVQGIRCYAKRLEEQLKVALARVAELERKLRNEENAHTTTIEQRDNAEHWADQLANAIAERFGVDIGEHSNLNCPWNEALVWMQQPPAQAQHSVPEGWRIERSAERIVVMNLKNGAGYAAARDGESGIAESVLYLLAADLLAASPGKEGV
ncbi:hypothetical protein LJ569_25755 [Pseudomonas aeruginosa]|uniref:hypothetical protein n=1 Tax=Pseudomonas aeruginosa TaxID=287 RepID=UPI001F35CEF2|nr:hypothetical protein [Pseudomonas aeruginosa]MCF8577395.1 hypothetical protein [Pseudomonas aeruginosa]MCG7144350.1 hypothetical protein [Pseudomonas aeruginosa]MCG7150307.1 hypothetical protein [Pseudomonas aeruginosa]